MKTPKIKIDKHPIIWFLPFVIFLVLVFATLGGLMYRWSVEGFILAGIVFLFYTAILYVYIINQILSGIVVFDEYLIVYEKKQLFVNTPKKILKGSILEIKVSANGFFANTFDFGTLKIITDQEPPLVFNHLPDVLENGKSLIAWNKNQ